jgi:NAD(P)-dependent dehydrogenase (short-subunit alcohol dehydrogenase family)
MNAKARARVSVVTGASRGIGLAIALRLARLGDSIVIAARGEARLRSAAEQIRGAGSACEMVVADVGTPEGAGRLIDAAATRFGRVDLLVNNAAVAPRAPIADMDDATLEQALRGNIGGVFYPTRAAWPLMVRQGGGIIVNISSVASVDPFPGFAVYGACKAWVNLFTQAAASEGRSAGIRVYAVAPGAVETAMLRGEFPDFPPEMALQPDDVAAVVETLCSDTFRHSSGQTIFVRK